MAKHQLQLSHCLGSGQPAADRPHAAKRSFAECGRNVPDAAEKMGETLDFLVHHRQERVQGRMVPTPPAPCNSCVISPLASSPMHMPQGEALAYKVVTLALRRLLSRAGIEAKPDSDE